MWDNCEVYGKCDSPITNHAVRVQVLAKVVVLYSEHILMIVLSHRPVTSRPNSLIRVVTVTWMFGERGGGRGCKLMQTIWQALSPMYKKTDERIQGGQIEVVFTHGQSKRIVLIIALNFSVFCHDFFCIKVMFIHNTTVCDSFIVSAVCSRGRRIFRNAVAIHVYLQEKRLPCFLSAI